MIIPKAVEDALSNPALISTVNKAHKGDVDYLEHCLIEATAEYIGRILVLSLLKN